MLFVSYQLWSEEERVKGTFDDLAEDTSCCHFECVLGTLMGGRGRLVRSRGEVSLSCGEYSGFTVGGAFRGEMEV